MPPAPRQDFRLYHGNDLEMLAGVLARELARTVDDELLTPDTLLIPQPAMRRWLQKTLAETHGIAANLRFLAPGEFVREALDANVPGAGDAAVGDAATLRWRLWAVLADPALMREPVFAPLRLALAGPDHSLAAWSLSGELSEAFEKYQAWRRDWLRNWDKGGDREDWQAELWRRATRKLSHRGKRLDAYLSRFDGEAAGIPIGLPRRVFAFACQNVSPDVLRVIASSARAGTLHFFFLSPVAGWWGDLQTARERLQNNAEAVFADEENPLLRANGAAGRDFVRTLFSYEVVHPGEDFPLYEPPDPEQRRGLLHRLQRDLLARRPPPSSAADALPEFAASALGDRSLQVHACHTRLREVQILHDQLRDLLERDPSLQARDIAVLTPDIDAYAAHVHAVFGGTNALRQQIPYALSDASAIASQPLAEAFMRLLALPGARFTVNEVLELLRVPAIAQRLQLEAADFDLLQFWLREAGARWGLDAAQRSALGAPAEEAFSWAWAIDRLLFGHASGSDASVAGVAPWPELEGSSLVTLDALMRGLRTLAHLQRVLAGAHSASEWQVLLSQVIDALFAENPIDAGDRRTLEALRGQIAAFGRQTANADVQTPVPLDVVQSWFAAALADSDTRQPFLTGGVTFGRMVPMRLVPFKVICLLGMNDGDFPRRDPLGSLNRLSADLGTSWRRVGDRSIREDDRGLFLQLFAAATQTFYISYLGQDPRSGETLPPSVVVAELLDVAARYFADAPVARKRLTVNHPLQPFSAEAFGGDDERRVGYHALWRQAADVAGRVRSAMPRFVASLPARISETDEETPLLSRNALYRALSNPSREFLSERIGLRLPERRERLPDAEPFDAGNGLHKYALTQRLFDAALAGDTEDRDGLYQRLLAEGLIAPGAAGRQEVAALLERLAPAVHTWRGWGADLPQARSYELQLDSHVLSGTLPRVHASGLRQFSASKKHGKTVLGLGIDALVWSALGECAPIRRLINGNPPELIATLPPALARERLQVLLDAFTQARNEALPFMPKAGYAFFQRRDSAGGWKLARKEWTSDFGEGRDPWVRVALRGADPFLDDDEQAAEQFRAWSLRVFSALPGSGGVTEPADD